MEYKPLSQREEELASAIVEAAYRVHKTLGPGLLEKVYEVCFCHELSKMGFHPQRQLDERRSKTVHPITDFVSSCLRGEMTANDE